MESKRNFAVKDQEPSLAGATIVSALARGKIAQRNSAYTFSGTTNGLR